MSYFWVEDTIPLGTLLGLPDRRSSLTQAIILTIAVIGYRSQDKIRSYSFAVDLLGKQNAHRGDKHIPAACSFIIRV